MRLASAGGAHFGGAEAGARHLSWDAASGGRASPRHLAQARRLGIFTLLDITLGKSLEFSKSFGDQQSFGAGFMVISRHTFSVRVSLFDGFIKADSFNSGGVWAAVFGSMLWLADAKAIFVAGTQYTVPLVRDLSNAVGTVIRNALGLIQGIASKIGDVIRKVKAKIQPTIAKVDAFGTRLIGFAKNMTALAEGIVDGFGLTQLVSSLLDKARAILMNSPAVKSLIDSAEKWQGYVANLIDRVAGSPVLKNITDTVGLVRRAVGTADNLTSFVTAKVDKFDGVLARIANVQLDELLGPVKTYVDTFNGTLHRVDGFLKSAADGSLVDQFEGQVDGFVDKQLAAAGGLGLLFASNTSPDAAAAQLRSMFQTALHALTAKLGPLQQASRRVVAAMSDPALASITPDMAARLPPLFSLSPALRIPTASAAGNGNVAVPPAVTAAVNEVFAAVRVLQDALCSSADNLVGMLSGDSDEFAVGRLPDTMVNASAVANATAALAGGGRRLAGNGTLSKIKSRLSVTSLRDVLGNVTAIIARVQKFASFLTDGRFPSAA
jgi:hypothetical protein